MHKDTAPSREPSATPTGQKRPAGVPLLTTYGRLHGFLGLVYILIWIWLRTAWPRLRQSSYREFADNDHTPPATLLDRPAGDALSKLLVLVLPHAMNALPTMISSVPHALFIGCALNLLIAGIAWAMIAVLRLVPERGRRVCTKLFISTVISAEVTGALFWIGHLLFGAATNFKVPTVAVNVWPDVISSSLVHAKVMAPGAWKRASLLALMEDTNLREIESFLSLKGVATLYRIMTSDVQPSVFTLLRWLLDGVPAAFRAGRVVAVPLCLALVGFVADLSVVMIKVHLYRSKWRWVWRREGWRVVKRVIFPPFLYAGLALGIGYVYLMHYPMCTMPDRLPRFRTLRIEPKLDYLMFTRSIPTPQGPDHLRINLDVFLPFQLVKDWVHWHAQPTDDNPDQPPTSWTFFSATRYNRRTTLRWPFSALTVWDQNAVGSVAIWTWPLTRGLLKNGVPVVVADTRGSGASRGTRPIDLDEPEIADIARAILWIKEQFWSNEKVAAGGVSYDGMSGLKVAALEDSPVDATVALYSPMHPVTELFQSNGMPCATFVDDYHSLTKAFEQDGSPLRHFMQAKTSHVPLQITAGFLFSFRLPQAARGWEEGLEAKHLAIRKQNWSLKSVADSKYFIDDTLRLSDGRRVVASDGGVTQHDYQQLAKRKIPTYWTAAQCDSSAVRALQKYFPALDHDKVGHTLVIGPWGHGGRRGCELGNSSAGTWACGEEDVYADVADFIKSDRRRSTSEAWSWVDGEGGHWTEGVGLTSSMVDTPRLFALDRDLIEVSTDGSDDGQKWSILGLVARVFIPPSGWRNDMAMHMRQMDFFGVAHDLTELGVIAGSRINELYDTAVATLSHWRFGVRRKLAVQEVSERGIPILHRDVTSSISTTGGLSRWAIVQHLLRTPLDTNYVLDLRLGLSRFLQTIFRHKPAEVTLELSIKSAGQQKLSGTPRVTIPFVFFQSDFPVENATYDMGVVAVLETILPDNQTAHYLSEGRALLSMQAEGHDHIVFANKTDLMSYLESPLIDTYAYRPHTRSRQHFVSDLFRSDVRRPWAVLTQVSFDMEAVSVVLRREARLRLTLLPEDVANFPWHRVERKFERYFKQPDRLRPLTQWHIARLPPTMTAPLNGHLTLQLPLQHAEGDALPHVQ